MCLSDEGRIVPLFVSIMTAYLQRLEGVRVSVAVQDDVVGHAEALSDSQVVEE